MKKRRTFKVNKRYYGRTKNLYEALRCICFYCGGTGFRKTIKSLGTGNGFSRVYKECEECIDGEVMRRG